MPADPGIMNQVLEVFLERISIGLGAVGPDARGLLGLLATLELLLLSLFWAFTGEETLPGLIRKILAVFFFIWIIDNYAFILTWITDGFIWTGEKAAGGSAVNINDPSGIVHTGLQVTRPILEHAKAKPGILGGGFFDALMCLVSALVIMIAYFILALQIFLTRIEFALISTLGLILIPFGVFKHTAFMAERVFGAIVSFGVKFMVLAFIVSVGLPLMETLSLPPDPSWPEMFSVMFGSLSIALLSIHAPGVASGLLSGGPSLSAAGVMRTGSVGTTSTIRGASLTKASLAGATSLTGRAGRFSMATAGATAHGAGEILKGTASGLGTASSFVTAGEGAAQSGKGLSGRVRKVSPVAGTVVGATGAAGRAAVSAAGGVYSENVKRVKQTLSSSYATGKERANRNLNGWERYRNNPAGERDFHAESGRNSGAQSEKSGKEKNRS